MKRNVTEIDIRSVGAPKSSGFQLGIDLHKGSNRVQTQDDGGSLGTGIGVARPGLWEGIVSRGCIVLYTLFASERNIFIQFSRSCPTSVAHPHSSYLSKHIYPTWACTYISYRRHSWIESLLILT